MLMLEGRRILVTGAAGAIGTAVIKDLVDCGAGVFATDLYEEEMRAAGRAVGVIGAQAADVTDEASVADLFAAARETLGGLDGVVHAAGVMEVLAGTRRQELSDWRRVVTVNLQGSFLVGRESARALGRGGAVVLVSSVGGIQPLPASNAYGVSKAGMIALTHSIASDLAHYGVRVNAVAPGVIDAPMASTVASNFHNGQDRLAARCPMGRFGKPDEVAQAITFLLSDRASYITGVVLPVDGGWSAFGGAGLTDRSKSAGAPQSELSPGE